MTFPTRGQPLRVESLRDTEQGGVSARLSGLPTPVRQLHREVLRAFLATGQPPHSDDLPLIGGVDRGDAFGQLTELDVVQVGADGRALVAYPFSGRPTGHTVQLDGGPVLHAMCAIDALGILLMTGRDGVIVSADPGTGHPVRVERRGEGWRWAPEDTAVLLAQSGGISVGSGFDLRRRTGRRPRRAPTLDPPPRGHRPRAAGRRMPVPDDHLPHQPRARRGPLAGPAPS